MLVLAFRCASKAAKLPETIARTVWVTDFLVIVETNPTALLLRHVVPIGTVSRADTPIADHKVLSLLVVAYDDAGNNLDNNLLQRWVESFHFR